MEAVVLFLRDRSSFTMQVLRSITVRKARVRPLASGDTFWKLMRQRRRMRGD